MNFNMRERRRRVEEKGKMEMKKDGAMLLNLFFFFFLGIAYLFNLFLEIKRVLSAIVGFSIRSLRWNIIKYDSITRI